MAAADYFGIVVLLIMPVQLLLVLHIHSSMYGIR